ncbi:MAG TPA: TonB-dependent receptor plug domain-containing protein, partial [Opitutaceae bacterium]
ASTSSSSGVASNDETIALSPFEVSSEKDNGYLATNAISGSRFASSIKDTPMPIEVITGQFIRDTGATDLRDALRYSAGILLQTQNDLGLIGNGNAYQGPGGVNNPEGATANPNAVQIKVRGFITNNALRDGFLRLNSTDSVNISRIEVVRGPAALLYGTGNFGGVVNYLVEEPSDKFGAETDVSYGSYNFYRGTVDVTGPITKGLNYRVAAAVQSNDDYTQYANNRHYEVAPSVEWKPTDGTSFLVDTEFGKSDSHGTGFQEERSVAGTGINNDQNEHGGFFTPPGANPRTFRLSGPDTFFDEQAGNIELKFTQRLAEGLYLLVGYNHAYDATQNLDVAGALTTNLGPVGLRQTVNLYPLDPAIGDNSLAIQNGATAGVIDQYTWGRTKVRTERDQERYELTYHHRFFDNHSKWLQFDNQLLLGMSPDYNNIYKQTWATNANQFNYKSPTDTTPIVFAHQGDGSPTVPMYRNLAETDKGWDTGAYITYQGKILDDRLTFLGGIRHDKNTAWSTSTTFVDGSDHTGTTSTTAEDTKRQKTYQSGISIQITKELSIFAVRSEGLQPNFSGTLDATTGNPAGATTAKSTEYGLKFDLLDGKISGTISHFRIEKNGYTNAGWWMPAPIGKPVFNPNKDIVYDITNFTPTKAPGGSNGGISNGAATAVLDQPQVVAAWDKAVASGAAFFSSAGGVANQWYVDATKPDGKAYMDAAFAANQADNGAEWPGWMFADLSGDSLVNNASQDASAFHPGAGNSAYQTTVLAHGADGQILVTVNKNFQFLVTGAYTQVAQTNFGTWAKEVGNDPYAIWYFQNSSWGLEGLSLAQAYTNPSDTSTRNTSAGQAAGDDTPKFHFDAFGNYHFTDGPLKGFSFGLGGYWESKRQYESGVTHGSGQLITDAAGHLVVLYTPSRFDIDLMAKYEWKAAGHDWNAQLNVYNLLDDTKQYGLIYSAPLTARVSVGVRF